MAFCDWRKRQNACAITCEWFDRDFFGTAGAVRRMPIADSQFYKAGSLVLRGFTSIRHPPAAPNCMRSMGPEPRLTNPISKPANCPPEPASACPGWRWVRLSKSTWLRDGPEARGDARGDAGRGRPRTPTAVPPMHGVPACRLLRRSGVEWQVAMIPGRRNHDGI